MSPTPVRLNQQATLSQGVSKFPNDLMLCCGEHIWRPAFLEHAERKWRQAAEGFAAVPATKEGQSGDTEDRCDFIKHCFSGNMAGTVTERQTETREKKGSEFR